MNDDSPLSAASSSGTRTVPMPNFQHLLASLQVRMNRFRKFCRYKYINMNLNLILDTTIPGMHLQQSWNRFICFVCLLLRFGFFGTMHLRRSKDVKITLQNVIINRSREIVPQTLLWIPENLGKITHICSYIIKRMEKIEIESYFEMIRCLKYGFEVPFPVIEWSQNFGA